MTSAPAPDIWHVALEAVEAVQDQGVKNLLDSRAYFDAQVRVVCPLLHDNPTLVDIRDYLIKTIRLEHARIKLGHYTASFDRLRAALQLSSAVHWMLAREAKARGAH